MSKTDATSRDEQSSDAIEEDISISVSHKPTLCDGGSASCNAATSRCNTSMNRRISALTSSTGRCQFSLLKANRVNVSTCAWAHASTICRADLTPARWPANRGRPCCAAQRPLPSMMMATCRGIDGIEFSAPLFISIYF